MSINPSLSTASTRAVAGGRRREAGVANQRQLLKEMVHYLPSVVVPSLAGFIAVAVYTRLLSPTQYGLYTLMFTACMFSHTFFISWLNKSIVRYYERYRRQEAFFATCAGVLVIALLVLSAVWLVAGFLLRPWISADLAGLLVWGPPVVASYSLGLVLLAFLRAMRQSARYGLLTSLNAVLKLVLAAVFIAAWGLGASGILLGMVVTGILLYFPQAVALWRRWRIRWRLPDRAIAQTLLRYGMPVMGVSLASMVLSASDRYLIEAFLGSAQVGIYDAGYRVTENCLQLLITFLTVAFTPALVDVFENQGTAAAQSFMTALFRIHLLLMVPATVGLCLLDEALIGSLLSGPFQKAVDLVPWIAAGVFLKSVTGFFTLSITLKEKTSLLAVLFAPPAIANILLNLALLPRMGILGAAVATLFSYALGLLLVTVVAHRLLPWQLPWATCSRVAAATLVMALAIVWCPTPPWPWMALMVKVGIGAGVYLAVILVLEKSLLAEIRRIASRRTGRGHPRRSPP